MVFSPLIEKLIVALRCLPGVGPKTAQRLAFHILGRDREGGQRLAQSLSSALLHIQHCCECRNFTETERCQLCINPNRDPHLLCVVERPIDIYAIEQASCYRGLYFVLMGHLSPLDGIGPAELGLPLLQQRLAQGAIKEIILATNPTPEGSATAHLIAQICQSYPIKLSKIANGVPLGGEIEWVNSDTLTRAFSRREQWLQNELG